MLGMFFCFCFLFFYSFIFYFLGTVQLFSRMAVPFHSLPSTVWVSFPSSTWAFGVVIFYFSYSGSCVVWYLTVDFTCISLMVSDTNHWFATWTSPSVSKHLQEPVKNMLHEDSVPFPLGNWWFYRLGGSCAYRLDSESKQPWHNMKDSNPTDSGGHTASCEGPPPPPWTVSFFDNCGGQKFDPTDKVCGFPYRLL